MRFKIGTKLLLGFIGMVVITALVSGIGFWKLDTVVRILTKITHQNAPQIESAVGMERYALRTILDGRDYLLYQEEKFHNRVMEDIKKIHQYLDRGRETAIKYNDGEFIAKVEDVQKAIGEYEEYYQQGKRLLEENSKLEWEMRFRGREIERLAEECIAGKDGKLKALIKENGAVEGIVEDLRIVNNIYRLIAEVRSQEKNYMLYKDQKHFDELKRSLATIERLYDQLATRAAGKADKVRINKARQAIQTYRQAVEKWRANQDELQKILGKITLLGARVQQTAMAVQDLNWELMHRRAELTHQVKRAAERVMLISPIIAIIVGLFLGIVISRNISKPIGRMVDLTHRIAQGDLDHTVEVETRDELADLAVSFNQMTLALRESREQTERYSQELEGKLQEIQALNEELQVTNEELQVTNEELEKKSEELQLANEELQTKTEELQSYVEELEVTTEELKTTNEELRMTNEELERTLRELKETQAQLVQAGKMAAVGQLAGGVAHELNNPLTGVLTYAKRLLARADDESLKRNEAFRIFPESLRIIRDSALRCKRITENLLNFSRQAKAEHSSLDINEVIENTLGLLGMQLKSAKIDLIKELQPNLPPIIGNSNQLQQVFTNLILNAMQAMPEGGSLRIQSKMGVSKAGERLIYIEFTDTGCGIPKENLPRIFEPFFTTRPPGKGTGLGLSISYGIIDAHNGFIEVESEEGKGTTFRIILPVSKVEPCWVIMECPPERRGGCPAYQKKLGHRCWTVEGTACQRDQGENWPEACKNCKVYKKLSATNRLRFSSIRA